MLEIAKVSTAPLNLPDALVALPRQRILQLDPPVNSANEELWETLKNALFDKQCDLIACVFYGRFGIVERLLSNSPREESEEDLRYAEIQYLILPEEPTPKWVYLWGYPMED